MISYVYDLLRYVMLTVLIVKTVGEPAMSNYYCFVLMFEMVWGIVEFAPVKSLCLGKIKKTKILKRDKY